MKHVELLEIVACENPGCKTPPAHLIIGEAPTRPLAPTGWFRMTQTFSGHGTGDWYFCSEACMIAYWTQATASTY